MAQDPNKFYYEDANGKVSEVRQRSKEEVKAQYAKNHERFLASREKYKNTPMPPQTPKEKADAARPGRVSGAEVAAAKLAKRIAQGTQAGHHVTDGDNHTRPIK